MRRPKCFGGFSSKEWIHKAYNVDLSKHGDYCDCDWYCMTLCRHGYDCMLKQEAEEKCERGRVHVHPTTEK